MARMIPPVCTDGTPSGERYLFNKLKATQETADWVVLHSLHVRRHLKKIEGELDMVVLVPGAGILCIEVKGCPVSRKDGMWIYPYETKAESPFSQASSAMHSLRQDLLRRDSSFGGLMFYSAVVFTDIAFDEVSPEWHPWQVIDRVKLFRQEVSSLVKHVLEQAHALVRSKNMSWYDPVRSRPTVPQVDRLASLMRGDFDCAARPRLLVDEAERHLVRLTEEQYVVLDALQDNQHVLIRGLAGTGKTFLAIEAARRAACEGKQVLLLCFNRLLAASIAEELADLPAAVRRRIEALNLHSLLLDIAQAKPETNPPPAFWTKELPRLALERLLNDEVNVPHRDRYDLLLVDEAQDILSDDYLDVLELVLRGSLAGGRWILFGDFERQAIYLTGGGRLAQEMIASLRGRGVTPANYTLKVNCRNAVQISETFTLACNVRPRYEKCLDDNVEGGVELLFWDDGEHQVRLLQDALQRLKSVFSVAEIMVLSMRADDKSCASNTLSGLEPLRSVGNKAITKVRYTSVAAFKGLEAMAVIVTDILSLEEVNLPLLYIAMSRAKLRLILMMHSSCRQAYNQLLKAGF